MRYPRYNERGEIITKGDDLQRLHDAYVSAMDKAADATTHEEAVKWIEVAARNDEAAKRLASQPEPSFPIPLVRCDSPLHDGSHSADEPCGSCNP